MMIVNGQEIPCPEMLQPSPDGTKWLPCPRCGSKRVKGGEIENPAYGPRRCGGYARRSEEVGEIVPGSEAEEPVYAPGPSLAGSGPIRYRQTARTTGGFRIFREREAGKLAGSVVTLRPGVALPPEFAFGVHDGIRDGSAGSGPSEKPWGEWMLAD